MKLIELFYFIFHEIWIRIEYEFNYTHFILTVQISGDSSKLWIFNQTYTTIAQFTTAAEMRLSGGNSQFRTVTWNLYSQYSMCAVCTFVACFAATRLNSSQRLALFQLSIMIKMNAWKSKWKEWMYKMVERHKYIHKMNAQKWAVLFPENKSENSIHYNSTHIPAYKAVCVQNMRTLVFVCLSFLFSACLSRAEDCWNSRQGPIQLFLADFRINNQRIENWISAFTRIKYMHVRTFSCKNENAIVHWLLPVELVVLMMVSDIKQCMYHCHSFIQAICFGKLSLPYQLSVASVEILIR